jgi:ATP-dependent RNA helicase DeaD
VTERALLLHRAPRAELRARVLPPNMPSTNPSVAFETDLSELLGPALSSALATKGYTTLTPVQKAVLDPALAGRDLRLSSQTGSGKTLAIGFVLRAALEAAVSAVGPVARPRALVIAPTRELAKQVEMELSWLYAPLKVGVVSVTGGANYRDEHRALSRNPGIVVGTPGRLLDHLNRGSIDAKQVSAVVLDEADRMLDLGFRDELEAILKGLPEEHRTHLVSATFDRQVAALADRVQKNAAAVQGTPLGTANHDIDHIVYLVPPRQRLDALINLLLMQPDEQTLIFARTRAEVSDITDALQEAGFSADALSGEMQQEARNRALSAFRRGQTRALVATDVAARGIDVQSIARVIQLDAPSDPDTYTHRSGRTGRAGRKGVSALLIPPAALRRCTMLLGRARVRFRTEPVPSAETLRAAEDARAFADLTRELEGEVPARIRAQVKKLIDGGFAERALSRLLAQAQDASAEPREIKTVAAERDVRRAPANGRPAFRDGPFREGAFRDRAVSSPQQDRGYAPEAPGRGGPPAGNREEWVPFHVSWGEQHGADARRLVAMLCRRGGIRSSDIGAIRVNRNSSSVEVAARVSDVFSVATRVPDARDPNVSIVPFRTAQQ